MLADMKRIEDILKAFADRNRLRIVHLLSRKKMCVCELAFVLGITQPSVSRHLKKLKDAGIIADEPEGYWTNYRLKEQPGLVVESIMRCIQEESSKDEIFSRDLKRALQADRAVICKG
jgi:ArsR family transcriptional regulator